MYNFYKFFITIFVRFGSYDGGSIYSVNMECTYLEGRMYFQATAVLFICMRLVEMLFYNVIVFLPDSRMLSMSIHGFHSLYFATSSLGYLHGW